MKFFILGLVLLIAGIPLLEVNLYVGMAVSGIGAVTAAWFKGQALRFIISRVPTKQ